MKVLHIFDHSVPLHSGYTFRSQSILRQQRNLGIDTYQLTGSKQGQSESPCDVVEDLTFYRTTEFNSGIWQSPVVDQMGVIVGLYKRLVELIPQIKPDLLHAHSPALNGVAALWAARRLNLPVVYEVRAFWEDAAVDHGTSAEWGMRYRLTRALETYVLKRAQAIFTICDGLKEEIRSRDLPSQQIHVMPNAVDITNFTWIDEKDSELETKLQLKNKTVLGFIGSFYGYEGLPLLIEALAQLVAESDQWRLLLVGGGPDEAKIRELVEKYHLQEIVKFTGRVPHENVHRYYSLVDLFVYPRYAMRLTDLVTPLKPLEAMAQGKLVVASDVGGHRELIEDGKNGYLFRANDVESLVQTLKRVQAEQNRHAEILARGRQYVERERNWPVVIKRYLPIYESLVDA
ncbi:MAG TPA: glycosyltransferase, exosortase A system-associated [Gammaproteobacteria bacterium]|nr:glycosyltransferase, exosortase A system-associated [Gammaproteobacteria bacterium]